MVNEFVVEASAVAKLFLDEAGAPELREWWYRSLAAGAMLLAPSLLRFELGNIIVRNLIHLDAANRRRAWREALAGIRFTDEGLPRAFDLSSLTFYDRAYVALAAEKRVPLVTFDARMAEMAQHAGVTLQGLS